MSNVNNSKKPWTPLPEKSESVRNPKSAGLGNPESAGSKDPEFEHQNKFMAALNSEYNYIYNEFSNFFGCYAIFYTSLVV